MPEIAADDTTATAPPNGTAAAPEAPPWFEREVGEVRGLVPPVVLAVVRGARRDLCSIFLFVLPFYVVFSVAFGSVDFDNFGTAVPYYAPWWWSFDTFNQTLSKFYVGTHIYQAPLIRTFEYVFAASLICLVLGYAVAYYTARFATKYKGLILILLVSPFWISYLMRIYAWQGLLDTNGPIN